MRAASVRLRYSFVEVQCEACRQVTLVAFSCKGRGWCPSCTTRRAIEAGVHAEASLPMVSHRQWTLSLPRALRLVVVKEPRLFKLVERTLVRAVGRAKDRCQFQSGAGAKGKAPQNRGF